jgi:serine/threonine protein kinase
MEQQVFGDNYVVKDVLGEGSFGVVYLCHDQTLDRSVALKKLKPEIADSKELKRFLNEARRMASLTHENIIQVYLLDEATPFIVMEYFPGRTLRELRGAEPVSVRRALRIMRQVANGLQGLHELGIIHRDLSTNNIMVGPNDRAKILDLGLARDVEHMSVTWTQGNMVGTMKYMAPEVIDGQSPTTAADVFSFGVILYELLAGKHPFEAEHFMSMFYNIVDRPHAPLADGGTDLPPGVVALVDECLTKDPAERLSDWQVAMDRFDSAVPLPDGPSARTVQVSKPAPRKKIRFRNPYFNRAMVKRAADFFGRKQEVERIFSRLSATPPGSVSVVGDRKTGKSSLLNFIYMPQNRQRHLEDPDHTIMVYVDLQQQQKGLALDSFVDTVLGIANLELRDRMDVSDCSRDLAGIEQLVERLHDGGFRLVLLLDEFEAITANPNFSLEFFAFLRSLVNHYDVAYITSSALDLQQLCHTKEIRDSPFFNIFSPLPLSVFRKEEALELIRVPSAKAGRNLEPYENEILQVAGLFPFFLQVACCHCVEYMGENPEGEPDFAEVRRRFYEEARLHYRFMWDSFDEHERSTILRVADGRKVPDSLRDVCDELQRRHYLEAAETDTAVFSSCFREFITSEVSSRRRKPLFQRLLGFGDRS